MVFNEMSNCRAVLVMSSPLRWLLQASCARLFHFNHNADGRVVVKAASVLWVSHRYTVTLVHWLATVSDLLSDFPIGWLHCQTQSY